MKKLLTLIALLLVSAKIAAQETRISHRFGGRIDLNIFSDTYKSIESRGGILYLFPSAPSINSKGEDINARPQLRISAATTRFNYTIEATNLLGGTAKGFIETDFLGTGESFIGMLRLRHAYINIVWTKSSLLMGQTWHLTMPDVMAANTVLFGGGYPIYPLARNPQIQYTYNIGKWGRLTAAAGMFGGEFGQGQSNAMIPDVQLRFQGGNPADFVWGAVGGVKVIRPRVVDEEQNFVYERATSLNAVAYARYTSTGGYAFRLYGIWGQDLTPLGMVGGYAPLYSEREAADYGYGAFSTVSAQLDIESPVAACGWQWGLYGGLMKNLGSPKELLLSKAVINHPGMDNFWRISPRLYYNYGKHLTLGLEYLITGANWMKKSSDNYLAQELHPTTYNNRVTILARYRF